jgi:hypothetical protein
VAALNLHFLRAIPKGKRDWPGKSGASFDLECTPSHSSKPTEAPRSLHGTIFPERKCMVNLICPHEKQITFDNHRLNYTDETTNLLRI